MHFCFKKQTTFGQHLRITVTIYHILIVVPRVKFRVYHSTLRETKVRGACVIIKHFRILDIQSFSIKVELTEWRKKEILCKLLSPIFII